MAIVLPRQKGALAGLSEALGPLLQKIQADNAREKQARELSSVVNFLQAPQSANVPIPQVGGQAGNVLSQGIFQRQQFAQQQGLQKQNQQAELTQAIAIQNAKSRIAQGKTTLRVVKDPETGEFVQQLLDEQGNVVKNLGPATLKQTKEGVASEAFTSLQKPVAVDIQKDMKDATVDIANLEAVRDQFKPEFTEVPFKVKQKLTKIQEKAGGFLGEPSKASQEDLSAFSKWKRNASREFVVFKKWATGVAAGQKEMAQQIETAFASPRTDSATEFKSKIDSSIKVRKRTLEILRGLLKGGSFNTNSEIKQAESESLRQALLENQEGLLDGDRAEVQPEQQAPEQQVETTDIQAALEEFGL